MRKNGCWREKKRERVWRLPPKAWTRERERAREHERGERESRRRSQTPQHFFTYAFSSSFAMMIVEALFLLF